MRHSQWNWSLRLLGFAWVVGTAAGAPFGRAEEPPLLAQRVQSVLRTVGLEYEVSLKPPLWGRSVPDGFLVGSPEVLFDVLLPARGLAYDMLGPRHLELRSRQRPWFGPEQPGQSIPTVFAERKSRIELDSEPARVVARALEDHYGMPVLLDYRIADYQVVRGPLQADSLEGALGGLQREEGWQWFVADSLLVLLPSAEEQVLGLPNDGAQKWIYAGAPMEVAVTELARSFAVDFEVAESLLPKTVSGTLEGATLGNLLERLGALCECSFAVADRKVYLAPRAEIELRRLSTQPRKVLVELEVLEVPEKRWKALEIVSFLTRFPAPSAEEQETFLGKVRKASGVRPFAKTSVLIESGTEAKVDLPLSEAGRPETGYFIQMLPFLSEGEWIQLRLGMEFREPLPLNLPGAVRSGKLFKQPVHADFVVHDRQLLLLQGAVWKRDKKSSVFLIALRPTLQEPGAGLSAGISPEQLRWHVPWNVQVEEDVPVVGVHHSGLPAKTRKISGDVLP